MQASAAAAGVAARGSNLNVVRRAAFDIGSGMSKMQVSDIDLSAGRVVATLFAEEREVLFAADWKASGERSELSEEIQMRGLEVLGALRQIASELGATQMRGVATEVFRKASNGDLYLERVAQQLGIFASVIAQTEEARLGWLTAVAALPAGEDASKVVAWDSGGGSFQVSARPGGQEIVCYNGAWGSTVATEALMARIQGVEYTGGGSSPNPVNTDEAERLIDVIRATMEPPPRWLAELLHSDTGRVVAIGI
jgi:exopolyphosphatase/guanosine-5'-triphosphate,3'-diphosphate pyrophosphatase|eukprot:COSAG02_NODE_198_length_29564_cov_12.279009_27_plen_253_part_00